MKEIQSTLIRTFLIILTIFICLFAFTKVFGPIPFSVNSIQTTKSDLFSSTGTGEVNGTPTTARVSLGVTKTEATAEDAKNELNKVINAVIADLKTLGIEDNKIKTVNFSVNPDYSQQLPLSIRPETSSQPTQFTATANLDVETKDVDTANKAIDIASKNGANLIGGVNFDLSDEEREKLEDQARVIAIKDAKENAEKVAKAAGIKLGKVVNIAESGGVPPVYMSARSVELKEDAVSEPTNLQPGENTVTINVTLFYETL